MCADRVVYERLLRFYFRSCNVVFALLTVLIQCSQESRVLSEEEADRKNLEIKDVEENEGKTSPEGVPSAGDNGSERQERKELEVSDAGGTLYSRTSVN